ncbi:hypothetical protein KFK09_022199 [Dendrobium nobile]|uniref:TNase-like domain-containing protein n=1 Tax=Dendrobium nobile TaxID=94219 RepID=A0A8T3AJC0_DENNO|nr:hypothetical protein KFK09_022199 [Dendrobium nobile]
MRNAMRFLCEDYQRPTAADELQILDSHGVTIIQIVGVAALVVELHHLGITSHGFLAWYAIPYVPQTIEEDIEATTTRPEGITPPCMPEGVQFELLTLPVDKRAIGDGDGFTAYVNITEPRELKLVPQKVIDATKLMENARDAKDFKLVKLIKKSVIEFGYRFINLPNQQEVLARKYRIRLRGVDAPEIGMKYGDEAKQVLVNIIQGKCLKIHVYNEDRYGRKQMLKRGCVWHYLAFDPRPEFAKWQKEARDTRRGLWALPDPEKPWEWRRNNPREHSGEATILFRDSDSVENTRIKITSVCL